MEISIDLQQKDNCDYVRYTGPINEEAEVYLTQLLARLGSKVIINLGNVKYVNSCGVRGWINFMRELDETREVVLEECTSEIVMQINMIPSFKGKAKVKSVYAAYECDSCGHEMNVLFEEGKNLPTSPEDQIAPTLCPQCQSPMEMLELEEEFFSFLAE
jgi:anti-anti-sigma regulatory factor